jgi:hypothetical protein
MVENRVRDIFRKTKLRRGNERQALSSLVIRHNAKKIKRENIGGDRPHNKIAFKVYNIELMKITTVVEKTNRDGVAVSIK